MMDTIDNASFFPINSLKAGRSIGHSFLFFVRGLIILFTFFYEKNVSLILIKPFNHSYYPKNGRIVIKELHF